MRILATPLALLLGLNFTAAVAGETVAQPAASLPDGVYRLDFLARGGGSISWATQSWSPGNPSYPSAAQGPPRVEERLDHFDNNSPNVILCRIGGKWQPKQFSTSFASATGYNGPVTFNYNASPTSVVGTNNASLSLTEGGCPTTASTFSRSELFSVDLSSYSFSDSFSSNARNTYSGCISSWDHGVAEVRTSAPIVDPVYIAPVSSDSCALQPFRAVSLNPFWTYPFGATTIDLNRIAREIDTPGSSPGTNPSGPPIATSITTDGVSRIIIGVRTMDPTSPIVFKLSQAGRGRIAPLTASLFSAPTPGSPGPITFAPGTANTVMPVPGKPGVYAAAVVFVVPETPVDMKPVLNQSVVITQGTTVKHTQTISLSLMPPPVLLVHGIWSGPSTWAAWDANFPANYFPFVDKADYSPTGFKLGFADNTLLGYLEGSIVSTLGETRRRGIVATQVNVVGHSMGGLVTRAYVKKDFPGVRLRSFGAGDVNNLITIDTPHLGSKLADILDKNKDKPLVIRLGGSSPSEALEGTWIGTPPPPTVAAAFAKIGKPVGGASASLIPGGPMLTWLNSGTPAGFTYETVASWASTYSFLKLGLDILLNSMGAPRVDQLLSAQNDVIVSLASQERGPFVPKVFTSLIHTDIAQNSTINVLNSPAVTNYVTCRLLNKSTCPRNSPQSEEVLTTSALTSIDNFLLTGRTQVASSNISLTPTISGALLLGTEYQTSPVATTRTLLHYVYSVDDGEGTKISGDAKAPVIAFTPTRTKPITLRVIAAFSDNTYAIRTWTFPVTTTIVPSMMWFDREQVRLPRVGSQFQLHPTAYVQAPNAGSLDVSASATYTIVGTGGTIVKVDAAGVVTGLKRGTAQIKASYKGKTALANIAVQ